MEASSKLLATDMAISLAKNKSSARKSDGPAKPGVTLGLLAGLIAASAFVAQMYVPKYGGLAFMVLAGFAAFVGLLGALVGAKGLAGDAKGAAILGLLINIGVLGGVAYGFTNSKTQAPGPVANPANPEIPTAPAPGTPNAPAATNSLAEANATNTPPAAPAKVDENRSIPRTTRVALLRARTQARPKPKPVVKPVIKIAKATAPETPPTPEPKKTVKPKAPENKSGIPDLQDLLPSVNLPPMPRSSPLVAQRPRTFRGATMETFDEINLVSKNFQGVNQTLDVWQLLDVGGMNNENVIAGRRKQIITWIEHYVAFKTTVERAHVAYTERLRQINTPAEKLNKTISRFREMRDKTYGPILRQSAHNAQVNTAAEGALRVLEENFTGWRLDSNAKQILFDSPKIAAAYSGAIRQLNQATAAPTAD